ncbi:MAG: FHA domain-containing protein [Myxococcaceae bacterium]
MSGGEPLGFHLTVAKGQQEGKSFDFEQAETNIGRTADNDVILYDPGVSRRHARIFSKDGKYFAEDMGSSNGTKVNGETISGAKELKSGDTVAVGPVVFAFELPQPAANATMFDSGSQPAVSDQSTRLLQGLPDPAAAPAEEDPNATRIKDLSEIAPSLSSTGARKSMQAPSINQSGPRKSISSSAVSATGARKSIPNTPAVAKSDSGARKSLPNVPLNQSGGRKAIPNSAAANPDETMPPAGRSAELIVRKEEELEDEDTNSSKGPGAVATAGAHGRGSAVERLRRRRQYGDTLGGQLAFLWSELSGGKKATIVSSLMVLVIGTGVGFYFLFRTEDNSKVLPPEPTTITRTAIPFSFGYGDDVDYERVDQKIFSFEFAAAGKAVAVLRYQASNISQNEVSITLNGVEQGKVPPDQLDRDREEEQLLAPKDLKKGETNQLIFDNTKNPPGKDTWKVSNMSVEIIPIPEGTDEELRQIASDYARKGKEFYDSRDVGADNLFRAWKNYRASWLTLEAMNDRPEMYLYVRENLANCSRELDAICRRMILDVQRNLQLKNSKKASQTLDEIQSYFPTNEHRCHNQALAMKAKLDL